MSCQPPFVVSNFLRTDDFDDSCSKLLLPNLEIDTRYTLNHIKNPLFEKDVTKVPTDGGALKIPQRMMHSIRYHVTGSSVIIDDMNIRSTSLSLALLYLECYSQVYLKYRVILKLKKCDFLMPKLEFVGHDIRSDGNTTASSKYQLVTDWKLPSTGDGLHSFVCFCNFYNKFFPFFKAKASPLRLLYTEFLHKAIPSHCWTPDRIALFNSMKVDVTSAPVLARYDSEKPVFLKTDWSSVGMSFILMQPCNDAASRAATAKLLSTGECDFDLTMSGPCLQPFHSGFRACSATEAHYHSFVGEVATLRWAISCSKSYLWGLRFWVLCNMKLLDHILEYNDNIHCLRRWFQELQAYNFAAVH